MNTTSFESIIPCNVHIHVVGVITEYTPINFIHVTFQVNHATCYIAFRGNVTFLSDFSVKNHSQLESLFTRCYDSIGFCFV